MVLTVNACIATCGTRCCNLLTIDLKQSLHLQYHLFHYILSITYSNSSRYQLFNQYYSPVPLVLSIIHSNQGC